MAAFGRGRQFEQFKESIDNVYDGVFVEMLSGQFEQLGESVGNVDDGSFVT